MLRGRHRHVLGLGLLVVLIYGTSLLMKDTRRLVWLLSERRSSDELSQEPLMMEDLEDTPTTLLTDPQVAPQADKDSHIPRPVGEGTANATLVFLARNSDLDDVLSSMDQMETRFNKRFGYPWVFLNEVEFDEEFKRRVTEATSAPVSFGLIPHDHWFQPDWIDEDRAREGREKMQAKKIIYAGFTITFTEWEPTIPTLWATVKGMDF
ncbi:hypothetical protein V5O48_005051 [Marasmius crinis-equi]|uniref:Uncharacterized protein n=1 Tax=Marasmius crinis-equi TaxID=585013 RepID=A0ABR3FNT8_9AGAR